MQNILHNKENWKAWYSKNILQHIFKSLIVFEIKIPWYLFFSWAFFILQYSFLHILWTKKQPWCFLLNGWTQVSNLILASLQNIGSLHRLDEKCSTYENKKTDLEILRRIIFLVSLSLSIYLQCSKWIFSRIFLLLNLGTSIGKDNLKVCHEKGGLTDLHNL